MGFRMSITYERRASQTLVEKVKAYSADKPTVKPGWKSWFSIWDIPEVDKELEEGVKTAIILLDAKARGWKPVAEGKETHYGVHGDANEIEFWYQRIYTQ